MTDLENGITAHSEYSEQTEVNSTVATPTISHKKQFENYKQKFLCTPKIVDRQTAFISRDLRDEIDRVVRVLGERKMSVSGFVENVLREHLAQFTDDLDKWRRM